MLHRPGAGANQYTHGLALFSVVAERTASAGSAGDQAPALFLAHCANTPRERELARRATGIFAAREPPGSPSPIFRRGLFPQRSRLQLPAHLELTPAWNEISSELRRLVGDGTYEAWLG